jgi:hypothetical protein
MLNLQDDVSHIPSSEIQKNRAKPFNRRKMAALNFSPQKFCGE